MQFGWDQDENWMRSEWIKMVLFITFHMASSILVPYSEMAKQS